MGKKRKTIVCIETGEQFNGTEDARITDTMNEFTWFMGRRYKLVDAADHIGYEWTGRAHGSLADALATLAVQRWLEQWLVAE